MDGSISLGPAGRKGLMEMYRRHPDPAVWRRAHRLIGVRASFVISG